MLQGDDMGPLFGWSPPAPSAPKPIEQDVELRRVVRGIGVHILEFLRERLVKAPEFHLDDLRAFVSARRAAEGKKCAPDSPRRVMDELGRQGWCEVETLPPRSASLYRVVSVEGGTP